MKNEEKEEGPVMEDIDDESDANGSDGGDQTCRY